MKMKNEDEDEDEYPLLHSLIHLVGHSNCKCRIAGHLHLYLHKRMCYCEGSEKGLDRCDNIDVME